MKYQEDKRRMGGKSVIAHEEVRSDVLGFGMENLNLF